MTEENPDKYVPIKEAASLLSVSPQTLRNWEKRGVLVPYRNPVNNYRLYKVAQIEEFLNQMRSERFRRGIFKLKVISED